MQCMIQGNLALVWTRLGTESEMLKQTLHHCPSFGLASDRGVPVSALALNVQESQISHLFIAHTQPLFTSSVASSHSRPRRPCRPSLAAHRRYNPPSPLRTSSASFFSEQAGTLADVGAPPAAAVPLPPAPVGFSDRCMSFFSARRGAV